MRPLEEARELIEERARQFGQLTKGRHLASREMMHVFLDITAAMVAKLLGGDLGVKEDREQIADYIVDTSRKELAKNALEEDRSGLKPVKEFH